MIKAFISHSSVQKTVRDFVETLGRDNCLVDCYDFEPAYRSIDEIFNRIESSTIFVLHRSRESI